MCLARTWFHSCKKGVFKVSVTAWKRCQGFLTGLAPLPLSYQHLEGLHPTASSAWLPSARAPRSFADSLLLCSLLIKQCSFFASHLVPSLKEE